ncbi:hypothetical protein ACSHMG_17545 [Bacillus [licheniformis] CMCC 63516]|uniref:hypothetical protein n=1 Tax=Bacillus paralicheniformis TaxID=1648923 RepID=UPI00137515ED|nr:hypothetical protein [Bacillus paralicheniformis]WOH90884.1 hypothetical protein RZN08_20420 [Bacillus paralicheniformis]
MFGLNLAHTSILELLEKAAEKNELIYVRARQRCVGKTTALLEFARKNNYPVLTKREIARCYQVEHPDLNIIGYVDGSEVDGLYNVVCDEGIPKDAVKRLHKLGVLLTGFVREEPDSLSAIREAVNYVGYKHGGTVLLEGGSIPKGDLNNLEAEPLNKQPLLQIELDDIDSVPRVFYKGEKITNRIAIDFEWRTGGADKVGSTYIRIKHGNDPDKALAVETKELAVGEKALEKWEE